MEEKTLRIAVGQKFRHKRNGTVYFVKAVEDNTVLLVSEKGDNIRRVHLDFISLSDLEPLHD